MKTWRSILFLLVLVTLLVARAAPALASPQGAGVCKVSKGYSAVYRVSDVLNGLGGYVATFGGWKYFKGTEVTGAYYEDVKGNAYRATPFKFKSGATMFVKAGRTTCP